MTECDMFVDETQRQIDALGASTVRLTLMSVSAPSLPTPVLESAVRTAAAPYDEIGPLEDGSLGLLSLRSNGGEGNAGVQHRFLLRIQTILTPVARRRNVGTVRFRAIHRWACELREATDLFNSLFDAPPIALTIPVAQPSLKIVPRPLAPHAASLLFPWHTPMVQDRVRNQRA